MPSTFADRLAAAGVLLVTLAFPASASAQYQLPTVISSFKADSLHEAAEGLVAAHRYRDAARLHRRSAELRPAEDPLCLLYTSDAADE